MDCLNKTDGLIREFTENYFGKLYYFFLKKTGGTFDAEELAAETALAVVGSLRKKAVPENFPAWVWKIARNKYAAWSEMKNKKAAAFMGGGFDMAADAETDGPETWLLHSEDINLLRRELAFISSEYRDVLVAYYIDYKNVGDIAASLRLPAGTVKAKLFRARNILKEGIEMAREFGVLSYKPENVGFIFNGMNGNNGEPWNMLNRALCKNILLAAYRTPSTAGELAVELGVALPYMEDELKSLVWDGLVRLNGKKYETNIFIVSAAAQEKIYAHLKKITSALTDALVGLIEHKVKCYETNGSKWHEGYQDYEDVKWAMLMLMIDEVSRKVLDDKNRECGINTMIGRYGHTVRPDGGEWDLLGMEEYKGEKPDFVGLHGCVGTPADKPFINNGQYKFKYRGIEHRTPVHLTYEQAATLEKISKDDSEGISQRVLDELTSFGYLQNADGVYKPTFYVSFKNKVGVLNAEQAAEYDNLYGEVCKIASSHYDFCREIIQSEVPDFFKEDRYQTAHACASIFCTREAVLQGALASGYITFEENDERKMLGAYLII
ncbi:MAG: hypothetical protein FWE82_01690 [Defluviitaleaceae bacterium]|nr:hypothetical protein [Defluviitaleaceae bacterium]